MLKGIISQKLVLKVGCILIVISISTYALIFVSSNTFAQSPSFAYEEIRDGYRDWKDALKLSAVSGNPLTDILSVNIFGDGKILNATLWLSDSLYAKRYTKDQSNLIYGMFVDADLDRKTGVEGIDYNIYISSENTQPKQNNASTTWTKTFEQWSSVLPHLQKVEKRIIHQDKNYTGFFAEGKKFIQLSFDLSTIGSPNQYRILLYTIEKKPGFPWIFDFTNWINFPPPNISISVQPENLELKPGENKSLELNIKSNAKFRPSVQMYTTNLPPGIQANFAYNKLDMPTFGEANTAMWIKASDVSPGPHTITVLTNSNILQDSISGQDAKVSSANFPIPELKKENIENFTTVSSFLIFIQPSIPLLQQIKDIIIEWQWLIAIGIGIVVDRFVPWDTITKFMKKWKKG